MENLKDKLPVILMVITAIVICVVAVVVMENGESVYYTQIDNSKIEKISSEDEMKYQYTLKCYSEKGKEKEISFKTSRELREDAYLKLDVKMVSGVHKWEEVTFEELPDKVKTNYKE